MYFDRRLGVQQVQTRTVVQDGVAVQGIGKVLGGGAQDWIDQARLGAVAEQRQRVFQSFAPGRRERGGMRYLAQRVGQRDQVTGEIAAVDG